jgi:hypothetical protein
MSSPVLILAEVQGSTRVIKSQARIQQSEEKLVAIKASLAGSLKNMIGRLSQPLTSAQCAELLDAVAETEFTVDQKQDISDALDAKLVSARVQPALGAIETQSFERAGCVLSYLTSADWLALADESKPFNSREKMDVVVNRLSRGGMWKPSLPVCADVVAAIASATYMTCQPDSHDMYLMVGDLMARFREFKDRADGLPVMRSYPPTPYELPAVIREKMYDDEEPVTITSDVYAKVRKQVSCKKSNKQVRQNYEHARSEWISEK